MFSLFKKNRGKRSEYKFKDSANTACFVCDHVLYRQRPILHITHERDGFWQFMCGLYDHSEVNAKIISLEQATNIDSSINELYEMPMGIGANRDSVDDKWKLYELVDEQEE